MVLESIKTIAGQFESALQLQQYCNDQYLTLQKAHEKINKLEAEIDHLKSLLSTTPLSDGVTEIIVSSEQSICEMEIERLRDTSIQRGLTLEETKRLDLLVKNLHLSKGQKKDVIGQFRNLSGISTNTLIQIAEHPEIVEDV